MRDFKGSNYDISLSTKEIAKKVRKFVKSEFKDCKFSVTSDRRRLSVDLVNKPFETRFENERGDWKFTEKASVMYDKINTFVESYNFDKSNPYEDYFNVNFYSFINL